MNEIDLTDSRAEQAQPQGFVPSHLAEPMLRDRDSRTTALQYAAEELGDIRLAADLIEDPLAAGIGTSAARLQRLLRALATGALVLALVTVALVAGPSAGRAEAATVAGKTWTSAPASPAMEGPEPDPVASVIAPRSMSVVLGAAGAKAGIRVATPHVTPRGYHCASAWSLTAFLGRACSRYATFTVPVTLSRFAPLGRSYVAITDDVAPMDTTAARVALDVRRQSRFGTGVWVATQYGDGLVVSAPLYAYTPATGRWTPQQASPVAVQELRAGRWVTVATGTTNRYGTALVTAILGGGVHAVRVARVQGATVTATTGTARTFLLEPTDVPDGIV